MLRRIEFSCAAILLVAVVILVGVASVARALGSPIIWSIEVAQLLFLWLCIVTKNGRVSLKDYLYENEDFELPK